MMSTTTTRTKRSAPAASSAGAAKGRRAAAPKPQTNRIEYALGATTDSCDPSDGARPVLPDAAESDDVAHAPLASDDENIIMQLSVKPDAALADPFRDAGSPSIRDAAAECNGFPDAYNLVCHDKFAALPCELGGFASPRSHEETFHQVPDTPKLVVPNALKVVNLLKDFEEKNKNNEWPTSTSIHCYWCSHRFDGPPMGVPLKHIDDKFHVFGCFCSLECAAAFNFAGKCSHDESLERYHLINLLARKLGRTGRVRVAPDRLSLTMFGGHLSIEEFRSFSSTSKMININFPPMLSMTQQIEEFNESDVMSSADNRYIPLDADRVNRYRDKIISRRTTGAKSGGKNTLDDAMKIRSIVDPM